MHAHTHTAHPTQHMKTLITRMDEDGVCAGFQEMKEAHENKMEEGALAPSELEKQQREREAFLCQQRDIIKGRHRPSHHRPLSRTQSSPLVTFSVPPQQPAAETVTYTFTTGLFTVVFFNHFS